MKRIPVRTTYMEMREPPAFLATVGTGQPASPVAPALRTPPMPPGPPRPDLPDLTVIRASRPTAGFYRYLYDSVGTNWSWFDRKLMGDEELLGIIKDDSVEIHVLYAGGVPTGFAELDRRVPGEVEMVYLGIMPEFIGLGLGRYLTEWTLRKAWNYGPDRVWLHTCELDHDAAIPLYCKIGFTVYDEKIVLQVVPGDWSPEEE